MCVFRGWNGMRGDDGTSAAKSSNNRRQKAGRSRRRRWEKARKGVYTFFGHSKKNPVFWKKEQKMEGTVWKYFCVINWFIFCFLNLFNANQSKAILSRAEPSRGEANWDEQWWKYFIKTRTLWLCSWSSSPPAAKAGQLPTINSYLDFMRLHVNHIFWGLLFGSSAF